MSGNKVQIICRLPETAANNNDFTYPPATGGSKSRPVLVWEFPQDEIQMIQKTLYELFRHAPSGCFEEDFNSLPKDVKEHQLYNNAVLISRYCKKAKRTGEIYDLESVCTVEMVKTTDE